MFVNDYATASLAAGLSISVLTAVLGVIAIGPQYAFNGIRHRYQQARRRVLLTAYWLNRKTLNRGYQGRHWQHRIPITNA